MKYTLARLTTNHLDYMRSLNKLFGDVFEDIQTYEDDPPDDEYITDFLANHANIVIVALSDTEVIGGLVAYHLPKFESKRSEVYLYDLAVSTEYQRKGVGNSLVNNLKQVALDLGAYVVFVQADEGDDAVKFYESLNPSENIRTRNFDFDTDL